MAKNLAFSALFMLVSVSLAGQNSTPAYGVDGVTTYVVGAWEMQTVEPGTQWAGVFLPNRHRYLTTPGTLIGVAHLPQGAQIVSMELEACDDSDVGVVVAGLTRSPIMNCWS